MRTLVMALFVGLLSCTPIDTVAPAAGALTDPPDGNSDYVSGWNAGYAACMADFGNDAGYDAGYDSGPGDAGYDAPPPGTCPVATPSKFLPAMQTVEVPGVGCLYNPHLGLAYTYRGSGHTHALPDHSGISAVNQETRLRDTFCGSWPCADFAWMTSHNVVIPDPGIGDFVHLYGSETYVTASGVNPHMIVFLPDATLADGVTQWFGNLTYSMQGLADLVETYGGLATFAHPMRYSPTVAEVVALDDSLWGIEAISGRGDIAPATIEANLVFIDARLSAGKYTCLGAGSDLHGATYGYDWGYQLVGSATSTPTPVDLWDNVKRCNFFAGYTHSLSYAPFRDPRLTTNPDGSLTLSVANTGSERPTAIRWYGEDGALLQEDTGPLASSTYIPTAAAGLYVRAMALRTSGTARLLSQPVWIFEAAP